MDAQQSSQASCMAVPWAVRTTVGGLPEALSGRGQCVELNKTFPSDAYCPVPHLDLDPRASALVPHAWPGERFAGLLGSAVGMPSSRSQHRDEHDGQDGQDGNDCISGSGQILGGLLFPTSPQVAFNKASSPLGPSVGCVVGETLVSSSGCDIASVLLQLL
ncbi:hypothetical protein Ancab_005535 [Ancistrocladus abbreviatus]